MTLKVNNIPDWTQAQLDDQIALGFYPAGTLLTDITLPSDWNQIQPLLNAKITAVTLVDNAIVRADGTAGQVQGYTSNAPTIMDNGQAFFGPPGIPAASIGTVFNTFCSDLNSLALSNSFQTSGILNVAGSFQSLQFNATDIGSNNVNTIQGINGIAAKNVGSGTIASLIAINASPRINGTVVATAMTGFNSQMRFNGVGCSAVTATDFNAGASTAGGTVTNLYAFRAAAKKVAGVATGYAFASDGVSDISYMLGTLGVGNNAPSTTFHVSGPIRCASYTVATLPLAATVGNGTRAHVTDALGPAFMAAIVGGGAIYTPVYSDGIGWFAG